jgi:hypothetical protein
MSETREFTLDEANALVPELHRLVSRQMLVQDRLEELLRTLHKKLGKLPRDVVPRGDDPPDVFELKEQVSSLLKQLEDGWGEVSKLGAVVKDPRLGLVDFYGRVAGVLVFLCWKFGEESISHYHGVDEGFAGRKPLASVARHRLFN